MSILKLTGVSMDYEGRAGKISVLRKVDLEVSAGETVAVIGPSGSGKTTLLSLCAGLETPAEGTIELLGHNLADLDEEARARLRNREVGFIFQSFHLMPSLTAVENVMLPLELQGGRRPAEKAARLLDQVGLENRMDHYPAQLSGGEQQRVAIARAFINQPQIIFADEPIGNLDRETSARVTDLLFTLNLEKRTTLMLITHDESLAERAGAVYRIESGRVVSLCPETETAHG